MIIGTGLNQVCILVINCIYNLYFYHLHIGPVVSSNGAQIKQVKDQLPYESINKSVVKMIKFMFSYF